MTLLRTLPLHPFRFSPRALVVMAVLAMAVTLGIALLIPEGRLIRIDWWMLRASRRVSPAWWSDLGWFCGVLGGPFVTGTALLALTGFAVLRRRFALALALPLALMLGSLVELALKFAIATPWFPGDPHWVQIGPGGPWVALEVNGSYPSGHVLRTTYLVLAAITVFPRRTVPIAGFGLVLIGVMVGTRISEHAHWFTDTVGGFTLALAAFALALLLAGGLPKVGVRGGTAVQRPVGRDSGGRGQGSPQGAGDVLMPGGVERSRQQERRRQGGPRHQGRPTSRNAIRARQGRGSGQRDKRI